MVSHAHRSQPLWEDNVQTSFVAVQDIHTLETEATYICSFFLYRTLQYIVFVSQCRSAEGPVDLFSHFSSPVDWLKSHDAVRTPSFYPFVWARTENTRRGVLYAMTTTFTTSTDISHIFLCYQVRRPFPGNYKNLHDIALPTHTSSIALSFCLFPFPLFF